MTLNSTLAEKTVVGQIQSRYRGSRVNHIALETSDIFALVKYMEQHINWTKNLENYLNVKHVIIIGPQAHAK